MNAPVRPNDPAKVQTTNAMVLAHGLACETIIANNEQVNAVTGSLTHGFVSLLNSTCLDVRDGGLYRNGRIV